MYMGDMVNAVRTMRLAKRESEKTRTARRANKYNSRMWRKAV